MYVKPSANTPAAIRKARWLKEQQAANAAAKKKVEDSLKK